MIVLLRRAAAAFFLAAASAAVFAADGASLLARFECNRCHRIERAPDPPLEKQCLGCHERILSGAFNAPADLLSHWQGRLTSLTAVPSLIATAKRFKRSWLADYLISPVDLRPSLPATMPRLQLKREEAQQLAELLAPENTHEPAPAGNPANGRRKFETSGCGACHRFSGADVPASGSPPVALDSSALARAIALAPDLRFTRERFRRENLARWIRDPASLKADTPMPALPMSDSDAADLAAWILTTPLAVEPAAEVPKPLPLLEREVRWPEVEERVFRKICRHCHADAAYALGDGGPGNTGGFGFAARGFNLATYQGISSGIRDRGTGRRVSVFAPGPDGTTPLIVAAMLARHAEIAGRPDPGLRGMPLGLPPIPLEDIQKVATWISLGRPR